MKNAINETGKSDEESNNDEMPLDLISSSSSDEESGDDSKSENSESYESDQSDEFEYTT